MLLWLAGGLTALTCLITPGPRLRPAAAGLVVLSLGVASLGAGTGQWDPGAIARLAGTAALPASFLHGSVALVVLGAVLTAAGARHRGVAAAGAVVAVAMAPIVQVAAPAVIAGLVLVGLGTAVAVVGLARALGRKVAGAVPLEVAPHPPVRGPAAAALVAGAGALLSHQAHLTLGLAIVAFGAAAFVPTRLGRLGRLILPGTLLLLGFAAAFTASVVGELPATYHRLVDGPFSPAASVLLAGCLLVPALVGLGAWPVHQVVPSLLLAPAGVALIGRFGSAVIPLGLSWWVPAVFPLAIIGCLWGLVTRRDTVCLAGLSLPGLWIGTAASVSAAATLLAVAMLLAAGPPAPARWHGVAVARLPWLGAAAGVAVTLWAAMQVEVVYTVLLALALAIGLAAPGTLPGAPAPPTIPPSGSFAHRGADS